MSAIGNLQTALRAWSTYRKAVPGARTAAGDELAATAREMLTDAARIWDEGHAGDEHGQGLCECPNPYRVPILESKDSGEHRG